MDPVAFTIGPLSVRWYGILIVLGIISGLIYLIIQGKKEGYDSEIWLDFLLISLPLGFLGARLYYVIFNYEYYLANPGQIINVRGGGLAIHGGVLVGLLVTYLFFKRRNRDLLKSLDLLAPAILLAQGIGRWGNFINQEAYGYAVSAETLNWLPEFIREGMYIEGAYHHPAFLYQSLWNFFIFGLIYFFVNSKFYRPGRGLALYLIGYSAGRFVIEGIRLDSLYLGGFRIAQLVSLTMVIAGLALFYYTSKNKKSLERG